VGRSNRGHPAWGGDCVGQEKQKKHQPQGRHKTQETAGKGMVMGETQPQEGEPWCIGRGERIVPRPSRGCRPDSHPSPAEGKAQKKLQRGPEWILPAPRPLVAPSPLPPHNQQFFFWGGGRVWSRGRPNPRCGTSTSTDSATPHSPGAGGLSACRTGETPRGGWGRVRGRWGRVGRIPLLLVLFFESVSATLCHTPGPGGPICLWGFGAVKAGQGASPVCRMHAAPFAHGIFSPRMAANWEGNFSQPPFFLSRPPGTAHTSFKVPRRILSLFAVTDDCTFTGWGGTQSVGLFLVYGVTGIVTHTQPLSYPATSSQATAQDHSSARVEVVRKGRVTEFG